MILENPVLALLPAIMLFFFSSGALLLVTIWRSRYLKLLETETRFWQRMKIPEFLLRPLGRLAQSRAFVVFCAMMNLISLGLLGIAIYLVYSSP